MNAGFVGSRYRFLFETTIVASPLPCGHTVRGVRLFGAVILLATLCAVPTVVALEPASAAGQIKLLPDDIVRQEQFGSTIAMSGDTAIIGSRNSAHIFERVGPSSAWQEVAALGALPSGCFRITVAIDHDTAAVGCSPIRNAVFVFSRNAGGPDAWAQVAVLVPAHFAPQSNFGESVAIAGDTIVVGGPMEPTSESGPGAAYVFTRDAVSGTWIETATLTAQDGDGFRQFGSSVDISGRTIVVGAGERGFPSRAAAYIFERDLGEAASEWRQIATFSQPDPGSGSFFGVSVAIDGDTAVALFPAQVPADEGSELIGSAYVLERRDDCSRVWCALAKLVVKGVTRGAVAFPASVAISGDVIVIGAAEDLVRSGSASVFLRNLGGVDMWGRLTKLTAIDGAIRDDFGAGVAIDGDQIIVGAPQYFSGGNGSAYACRIDPILALDACRRAEESVIIMDSILNVTVLTTSCCSDSEFTITARLTHRLPFGVARLEWVARPFFEVTELSGGNVLRNADGSPGGVGARLTPDVGGDGVLSQDEVVTATFVVGLAVREPFQFRVHVKGTPVESIVSP